MLKTPRDTVADLNHAEACTASRPRIGSTFHNPAPVRARARRFPMLRAIAAAFLAGF